MRTEPEAALCYSGRESASGDSLLETPIEAAPRSSCRGLDVISEPLLRVARRPALGLLGVARCLTALRAGHWAVLTRSPGPPGPSNILSCQWVRAIRVGGTRRMAGDGHGPG